MGARGLHRFIAQLTDVAATLSAGAGVVQGLEWYRKQFGPVLGILLRADQLELKRAARCIYNVILAEWFAAHRVEQMSDPGGAVENP